MVEGMIGSGKTTTATWIHRFLTERHVAANLFLEGAVDHPADYEHTAWFGSEDWIQLLSRWPDYRTPLEAVSRLADGGHLVSYGTGHHFHGETLPDALLEALAARSVYDGIPLDQHHRLLTDRWREFARVHQESSTIMIFECCFLQNPLMKFVVQHDAAPSALVGHLWAIAEALQPLHPVVLYLAPSDIEGTIARVTRERPVEWREAVVQYHVGQAFGRARELHGWEGFLTFLRQRQALERDILAQLPVRTIVIDGDVSPERWPQLEALLAGWYPVKVLSQLGVENDVS